jgi:hypothetical protein
MDEEPARISSPRFSEDRVPVLRNPEPTVGFAFLGSLEPGIRTEQEPEPDTPRDNLGDDLIIIKL